MSRFKDIYVNKDNFFSIGIDTLDNRYYISIPLTIGIADYEEHYIINDDMFSNYPNNLDEVIRFVDDCKNRKNDQYLIDDVWVNRGVPY
ncbi:hypothetical protein ACWA5Z_04185 [Testudinibacter sp. P80/BLE/0925]|uniref:hypothetical protein n=1 Tax=Testudinibacter sp. TW-1 TaxID=3417757 RepID=UPI003D36952F